MAHDVQELKLMKLGEIRTRFAPSPTGFLHIGSARTCLFNFLFARSRQGRFILRIEDTDVKRSNKKFAKDIYESLKWLGIEWDEGPDIGGNFGPYLQSQRKEIYKKYLQKLLGEGSAYYCFCSHQDLETQRQYLMSQGRAPVYNGKCAGLDKKTVEKYLKEGRKYIIRFKTPLKNIVFNDLIRGEIEFDSGLIGDFSLAKNLDEPLYNFACVIDDFEMRITHVIRGEDHISNTPKQILIQQALNFPQPEYAHLPIILGPDKAKLSKRHGAVSVSDYKNQGYLAEAIVNFLAFLGWNPGTEREIYSMSSLIKEFSLERVKKGGAIFNINRLDYLNGFYIRQKPIEKLTEVCLPYLIEADLIEPVFKSEERMPDFAGFFGKEIVLKFIVKETKQEVSFDYLKKIISLYQERLKKLSEIVEFVDFFFKKELEYDINLLKWKDQTKQELLSVIDKLLEVLSDIKNGDYWTKQNLEKILLKEAEEWGRNNNKKDRGYLLWPLRVALTGKKSSAPPFEIAEILRKDKTLKRIGEARDKIKN